MKKCKVKNCRNEYYQKRLNIYPCCKKHYEQLRKHGKILKRTRMDKNEIIDCGDYYEIILYSGLSEQKEVARTKIDKDDLEKVKQYKWCLNDFGYARSYKIRLHQLIIGKKEGLEIDHINHNRLDNRKQNLRHCTRSENNINRTKQGGVRWHILTKKWRVRICVNYKDISLGYFTNKQEALKIRKQAEKKYFGKFMFTNYVK